MTLALRDSAAALAPASIGNIGVGLDVLGLAVTGPGDRVRVERTTGRGIEVADAGHAELPTDPAQNTASIAAQQVLERAGAMATGLRIFVEKGLPLAGGQGGSAASAVAGAVATNRLLGSPLDGFALLACALEAEAAVAGRHADNLAPSLFGGISLVRSLAPMDVVPLPIPVDLQILLVHPDQRMKTSDARAALPAFLSRAVVIHQLAHVAAMVSAFHSGDLALLGRSLDDQIAEPARSVLLPGFAEAKAAALAAGALGGSISGAGPTSFYFCDSDAAMNAVAIAVSAAYAGLGISCVARPCRPSALGALALPEDARVA
jgi:homoserine kinase